MGKSKKITLKLYAIEATNGGLFKELEHSSKTGSFDSGQSHFIYNIENESDIGFGDGYFISLVKETEEAPVWFKNNGEIADIPLDEGGFGILSHAFIFHDNMLMITDNVGNFKKLLNEFSKDDGVIVNPVFQDNIVETVLNWDYYKKMTISLNFPTQDDLAEFNASKEGRHYGFADEFGGLKFDASIAAPKQKQVLNADQIRSAIRFFINNDFCSKLLVKGADFETENIEQIDLKNAQVAHTETIDLIGKFIKTEEMKSVMGRSYNSEFRQYIKES